MKVNVDYDMVLDATDKLSQGKQMTVKETQEIVKVLKAVQGDYIPTREEMKLQQDTIERLDRVDPDKHPDAYNRLLDICTVFENKYC